ncbi:MAG: hypothetical protein GX986_09405 [Firmicutes bacterium]|jgi:hypothetical protein|nr:hypothetical protein [Bacillota bacterium]
MTGHQQKDVFGDKEKSSCGVVVENRGESSFVSRQRMGGEDVNPLVQKLGVAQTYNA